LFSKKFSDILENLKVDDVVFLRGKIASFQGNITNVDMDNGLFELYVTHSTDEDAIGETIPINDEIMHIAFESLEIKKYEKKREDIEAMIDLSLAIKNEDLFHYACEQLQEYDKRKKFVKSRILQ
jgi:hypothetical protein